MRAQTRASRRSGLAPLSGVQVQSWSSRSSRPGPTWKDLALLVEGGDGLGPDELAAAGADGLVGNGGVDGSEDGLHELAAVVDLADDAVGGELAVRPHGAARPSVRRQPARAVGEDVEAAVDAAAGNDDAGLVGAVVVGNGGVDGDNDAEEVRGIGDGLEELPLPEGAFDVVQELGVDLLAAQACALVAGGDPLEEGLGEVGAVLVGGAAGDFG